MPHSPTSVSFPPASFSRLPEFSSNAQTWREAGRKTEKVPETGNFVTELVSP